MLVGLPLLPTPLSLLQARPGTETVQPLWMARGRSLLACLRAGILWCVWWLCPRLEACTAHRHHKRFPECTAALSAGHGTPGTISQRVLQLHSIGPLVAWAAPSSF